jgi:hypothetical protein
VVVLRVVWTAGEKATADATSQLARRLDFNIIIVILVFVLVVTLLLVDRTVVVVLSYRLYLNLSLQVHCNKRFDDPMNACVVCFVDDRLRSFVVGSRQSMVDGSRVRGAKRSSRLHIHSRIVYEKDMRNRLIHFKL